MDIKTEFGVGDKVYDDLTCTVQTIVGITVHVGTAAGTKYHGVVTGYWLDSNWLSGGRHPWEISALKTA